MNKISKTLVNQAYRAGNRLVYATYHNEVWTTNCYIAERGKIDMRVYKDQQDERNRTDKRPKLDVIIDNPVTVEPVTACVDSDGERSIVTTDSYQYFFNTAMSSYMVAKYGLENLLLEPMGNCGKIFAQDENGNTVAVLAGLTK